MEQIATFCEKGNSMRKIVTLLLLGIIFIAQDVRADDEFGEMFYNQTPKGMADPDELNQLNEAFLERINSGGELFLTHTKIEGLYTLRMIIGQTYVEEFGVAMYLAKRLGSVARVIPDTPLSLFERKYISSGHELWAFTGTVTKPLI